MRIGHLSDSHLRRSIPGTSEIAIRLCREAPRLLEAALAALRAEGADIVVVTGDLLDLPGYQLDGDSSAELRAAVREDYELVRELLDASGLPYLVVPGNHDDAAIMGEVFAERGQPGTGVLEFGGVRFAAFWDAADPATHEPLRVGAELDLFTELAADAALQVHLQHYLLTEPPKLDWPYSYATRAELVGALTASGALRLVLSGHYHPGRPLTREGGVFFSTDEALCEFPHRYRSYDIDLAAGTVAMTAHALES